MACNEGAPVCVTRQDDPSTDVAAKPWSSMSPTAMRPGPPVVRPDRDPFFPLSPMASGDADGPPDGPGRGLTDATGGDVVIGALV